MRSAAILALAITALASLSDAAARGPSTRSLQRIAQQHHARSAHQQHRRAGGRVHFHQSRAPSQASYPASWVVTDPALNKPEWTQALQEAIAAGQIPDIPVGRLAPDGTIAYPKGIQDPCNWTNSKCLGKNDIANAPDGQLLINFDDGPTPASPALLDFLGQVDQSATHFMIGSNILGYPDIFKQAIATGNQHIGVHTWSHNLSSTRSNEELLGELGWTMQIIYDYSGKIPRYWRPPQGDIDSRVRAIAENVFGLTAVMWNQECNDWCMDTNGQSECPGEVPGMNQKTINHAINQAVAQPHSPGVILLEHELTSYSVNAFIQHTWPGVGTYGWKAVAVPEMSGEAWYANAWNATSPTTAQTSMLKANILSPLPGASPSSSSSSSSPSASPSGSTKSGGGPAVYNVNSNANANANSTGGTKASAAADTAIGAAPASPYTGRNALLGSSALVSSVAALALAVFFA